MTEPTWVARTFGDPYLALACRCGWEGRDRDVTDWDVQSDRDRVVRCCPACDQPVAEWGTLTPISGLSSIAKGSLAAALENS